MKLWGRTTSVNVQKVIWGLEELQVKYEQINAGGAFGIVNTPGYLRKNPNGKVPLLEDGDSMIYESHTILRHIGRKFGQGTLYPSDSVALTQADMWMEWTETELLPTFYQLFLGLVRTPPSKRDEGLLGKATEKLGQLYGIVDQRLSSSPYLAATSFTIADIPLGTTLYRYFTLPIARPDLPALEAWYKVLQERKPYQDVVMTDYSAMFVTDE